MIKLLKYMKMREWNQVFASLGFIIVQVWLDLKLPEYLSGITSLLQIPGSNMSDIWFAGGKMLLCAFGSLVSAIIVGFFIERIAAAFSQRIRSLMFSKVDSFSMEEINRFSTASLITRSTNDITQVQLMISMGLQTLIQAPILAVWAMIKIQGKAFAWSAATGVTLGIMVLISMLIMILVVPKFKKVQNLTDLLNKETREYLTGLRVVRAYNADVYQEAKFEKVNKELMSTQLFTNRGMSVIMPMMTAMMSVLPLAIYWIGASLINKAEVADRLTLFSDMVVFSSYAMQVITPFLMLVMISTMLLRASVSAKRINEVLDIKPAILSGTREEGEKGMEGVIEFRNVSFKYPDASDYVLENINFTAKKGETIAFIGSTGSGKSTLINLIPRFYDVTEGEILVDGVNIKEYEQEALNNKIGYVPQKAVIFRGSVSSNVGFGDTRNNSTEMKDILSAVRTAQGSEFVEKMDKQYDADISQGGNNISGGQKQRLAIARAICRKPEIYIFDDSFSALDYKTDRILRSSLKKESEGVTSLIVAQRIGTIMDADQIIVLDEGRIVGKGTHKELLDICDVYREIAMSQLSEEELIS